jgi:hypothetical protein
VLAPSPLPSHFEHSKLIKLWQLKEDVELRAKLRVLETKRTDDARLIRELETKLADAETFVAIRPKLQGKWFFNHLIITLVVLLAFLLVTDMITMQISETTSSSD